MARNNSNTSPPESLALTPRTSSESTTSRPFIQRSLSITPSSQDVNSSSTTESDRTHGGGEDTPNGSTDTIESEEAAAGGTTEASPMLQRDFDATGPSEDEDDLYDDNALDLERGFMGRGLWENSWSESGTPNPSNGTKNGDGHDGWGPPPSSKSTTGTASEGADMYEHPVLTRGQKRRVYGGGRHGDMQSGGLGVGEVAGMILAGTLSPTPLILPHAAALLGLPLFIPLFIITGVLSWFAYLVIGVEARYCGSRSWPSLTSAVFPHRFKLHRLGELIASLLVLFGSLARGIVSVVAASEVVVDLFVPEGPRRRYWERLTGVGVIAVVWLVVPLIVKPLMASRNRRRVSSSSRSNVAMGRRPGRTAGASALLALPAYITALLWPLALAILGIRLKRLNADLPTPPDIPDGSGRLLMSSLLSLRSEISPQSEKSSSLLLLANKDPTQREAMGYSIWGGISILVFSLSSHHDAFRYLTSLARPPSTAMRNNSNRNTPDHRSTSVRSASPGVGGGGGRAGGGGSEGRRNQWPLASAIGVGGATLIQIGWALVGYLGMASGGREGNLFASSYLPRADPWLGCVRGMVLFAILVGIEPSLETAYGRIRKVLTWGRDGSSSSYKGSRSTGDERRRRQSSGAYMNLNTYDGENGQPATSSSSFPSENGVWDWRTALSRVVVWGIITGVSIVVCDQGSHGEGLASVAEIVGCIGSTLLGLLGPSIFFISLFHLRKPRSIFVSDPNAPVFTNDSLLMRKEREVQRKLSGRRIWQDVLVFGGLLPFGTVILVRGCVALGTKED